MWWSEMNFLFCEWILDLIREHTRGETRYKFLCPFDVRSVEDVVIDQHVVTEESHLHRVRPNTAHKYSFLPSSLCLRRDLPLA
jgi:hypothetical protein